jgi:2-methylcitrate dehydratase PrpD
VVAASHLLGLTEAQHHNAVALSLLRAGGTRGAFGSEGKAIQVGLAAAAGVQAALLARAGASVDGRAIHGPVGFQAVLGAGWPENGIGRPVGTNGGRAIERNWIKLHPSCLGTHSPIDAAVLAGTQPGRIDGAGLQVVVHPLARQAAHLDEVADGLSAKFSIPYCVAHTVMRGPPRVRDFAAIDPTVSARAQLITVEVDQSLPEFGAVLRASGVELARVEAPSGAPERPVSAAELAAKVADLAGERLDAVLADLELPAAQALSAAGLGGSPAALRG